ncbi:hypothetical protein D3C86_2074790 [compost metagenome]
MLPGMQEMAAELAGAQAVEEHQDVDADRLQADVVRQQFEQHAVEAGAEQADIQAVDQVPEIGRFA